NRALPSAAVSRWNERLDVRPFIVRQIARIAQFVTIVYPDSLKSRKKFLAVSDWTDSISSMIRSGFLSEEDRKALTALARDGSSPCRVTRRANALVLLDEGGAVSKSPMRCCLTTTRSAAGASSSSNAGSKGSPASMWAGAQAIWCEARGRFEGG